MIAHLQDIRELVGYEVGLSSWITVSREMIEDFARVTGGQPLKSRTPSGAETAVAQGQLILSLLPRMIVGEVTTPAPHETAISYGYDRVRFLTPVPQGAEVRGRFVLAACDRPRPGATRLDWGVTVEMRGTKSPALKARWLSMRLPRDEAPGARSAA